MDDFGLDLDAIAGMGAGPRLAPKPEPPPYILPPGIPVLDEDLEIKFPPANDLDVKTRCYLRDNPHVWELLVKMAKILVDRRERFAMKMLVEVARWKHIVEATDKHSPFKLSNSYTSYIARLLCYYFPPVANLIVTKEIRDNADCS